MPVDRAIKNDPNTFITSSRISYARSVERWIKYLSSSGNRWRNSVHRSCPLSSCCQFPVKGSHDTSKSISNMRLMHLLGYKSGFCSFSQRCLTNLFWSDNLLSLWTFAKIILLVSIVYFEIWNNCSVTHDGQIITWADRRNIHVYF